ncbi:hypothetical protein ACODT3_27430 [Streptomyces sp. 4.24]|uniref:hypothetical protein n=1 Tax=Streptomyces tritrimontium TaxID=3406573 RepID=UPI003BB4CE7E
MARVQTGCPDCKRCTNSAINEGGRKAGRAMAGFATLGISEVATRKCRACGHAMSLHGREDNARYDAQARPAQGAAWGSQVGPRAQPQPRRPRPQPQPGYPAQPPAYGQPQQHPGHAPQPPSAPPQPYPANAPVPPASAPSVQDPPGWRADADTSPAVITARLARLDALLAAGVLTAAEHAAQRAAIIASL